MFDNIGGKLKGLAQIFCWISIIVSVIWALSLWGASNKYADNTLSGLGVLIGGALGSWIGSWAMYALGETA